jgi:hypothetical protein
LKVEEAVKVRHSSCFGEYVQWYIQRDLDKGVLSSRPELIEDRIRYLRDSGKVLDWFIEPEGRWSIVELTGAELRKVYFVASDITRSEGLVRQGVDRTLDNGATHAAEADYFGQFKYGRARHFYYYHWLQRGITLAGGHRLVLRSVLHSECEIPAGKVYLQDGFGRALPYTMLVREGKISPDAIVEAFLLEHADTRARL